MDELGKMYDFIREHVRALEEKATDKRQARNKLIPESLKAYRALKGITKEELARQLGVVRMQVFRWETGRSIPGDEAMQKLESLGIVDKVK